MNTPTPNHQPVPPAQKTLKDRWSDTRQAIGNRRRQLGADLAQGWAVVFPQRHEPEETHGGFFSALLQVVLWLAFAAFLFASLPHVAYFFASFEPQENGTVNAYWWFVAYALALAID